MPIFNIAGQGRRLTLRQRQHDEVGVGQHVGAEKNVRLGGVLGDVGPAQVDQAEIGRAGLREVQRHVDVGRVGAEGPAGVLPQALAQGGGVAAGEENREETVDDRFPVVVG